MTESEPTDDDLSLEQKALDDIDEIAVMAEEAIRADFRGDQGELTDVLHQIHEVACSWEIPDSDKNNK